VLPEYIHRIVTTAARQPAHPPRGRGPNSPEALAGSTEPPRAGKPAEVQLDPGAGPSRGWERELALHQRAAQRLHLQCAALRLLAESSTIGEVAHRLLALVCNQLGWQRGELWNVDRPTRSLECVETWHASSPTQAALDAATRGLTLGMGAGLPGRVWSTRLPVETPDAAVAEPSRRAAVFAETGLSGGFGFPLHSGPEIVGVMVFYSRDGGWFDAELRAVFTGLTGQLARFVEHHQALRALRENEARFRSLSACSPVGIFQADPQGRCTYANPCCRALCGFAPEASLGEGWMPLVHPEDGDRVAPAWFLSAADARGFADEFRICPSQGAARWVHVRSAPMFSDTGELRGFVGTVEDITERKRSEAALRDLSKRILQAQEQERKRVARELHDSVIQMLTSAKFRLAPDADPAAGNRRGTTGDREQVLALLDRSIREVRRISRNLRPSELDDLGLAAAVRSLCDEFRGRTGVEVKLEPIQCSDPLPPEIELILYRILQEGLTNVEKHAHASRVVVALRRIGGAIELRLLDDGKGFPAPQPRHPNRDGCGLGLLDMQERASLADGAVVVESLPGRGTELTARLPLAGAAGDER
jgi:PAS domain S-box-containing protein